MPYEDILRLKGPRSLCVRGFRKRQSSGTTTGSSGRSIEGLRIQAFFAFAQAVAVFVASEGT